MYIFILIYDINIKMYIPNDLGCKKGKGTGNIKLSQNKGYKQSLADAIKLSKSVMIINGEVIQRKAMPENNSNKQVTFQPKKVDVKPNNIKVNVTMSKSKKEEPKKIDVKPNNINSPKVNVTMTTSKKEDSKNVFNFIDKILYINLDKRVNRKEELCSELKRLNVPEKKIMRISAIYNEIGYLGCTQSHIKCLEYAINNNYKNVMILEDDFNFIDDIEVVYKGLNSINSLGDNWDVIFLAGNVIHNSISSHNDVFNKVTNCQTASSYIVNSRYFYKLLDNLKEGFSYSIHELDQYWKRLQPEDSWYIFKTKLGYQRESYSDIRKRITSYGC